MRYILTTLTFWALAYLIANQTDPDGQPLILGYPGLAIAMLVSFIAGALVLIAWATDPEEA